MMSEEFASDMAAYELLAKIMQKNAESTTYTYRELMESYKRDRDYYYATLRLIRKDVYALFALAYTPSPGRIKNALYPTGVAIEAEMKRMAK